MKTKFAKALSRLRREAGFSQRQAATELGISQALLSHYENGVREPGLEFIINVCNYYDVSADTLLGRTDLKKKLAMPTQNSCDSAPKLISAMNEAFGTLDKLSDKELYDSAVNYLLIPSENVSVLLRDPWTEYDPVRDAKLKIAEAAFIAKAREKINSGE